MEDQVQVDMGDLFRAFVAQQQYGAMIYMGKFVHPGTGQLERNLDAARFTIDLLGMLDEKTRGNLTKDEEVFLRQVLTTLRLNYLDEQKKEPTAAENEKKMEDGNSGDTASGNDA
jgi:hypothetical protein